MNLQEILTRMVETDEAVLLSDVTGDWEAGSLLDELSTPMLKRSAYLQPGMYIAEIDSRARGEYAKIDGIKDIIAGYNKIIAEAEEMKGKEHWIRQWGNHVATMQFILAMKEKIVMSPLDLDDFKETYRAYKEKTKETKIEDWKRTAIQLSNIYIISRRIKGKILGDDIMAKWSNLYHMDRKLQDALEVL